MSFEAAVTMKSGSGIASGWRLTVALWRHLLCFSGYQQRGLATTAEIVSGMAGSYKGVTRVYRLQPAYWRYPRCITGADQMACGNCFSVSSIESEETETAAERFAAACSPHPLPRKSFGLGGENPK